jgi:hypothetical protein
MTRISKVLFLTMLVIACQFTFGSSGLPAANQIRIDCPAPVTTIVPGDSIQIPVRIVNDTLLAAFSLGFEWNSSQVKITSVDWTGSIITGTQLGGVQEMYPGGDTNVILIGWIDLSGKKPLAKHLTEGLLCTFNMLVLDGATPQCIDIDSTYVPPAGAFIFSPKVGNKIIPNYADCGTSDVILGGTTCPTGNTAPIVADIPNQSIAEGGSFATINLDDYVADAESADNLITWGATSASPNGFAVNINATSRVATITFPGGDFNGSALFTFTATDPGSLSASDTARFTVTPVNDPPVVAGIPDQSLAFGANFATITLDNYVTDVDNSDAEMTWSYSGNTALTVSINASRIATITKPSASWSGSETITFTATDPGSLSDGDDAVFTIATATPVISITPDTLVFSAFAGGAQPAGKGAMITNTGNGTLDWNAAESTDWLSLTSTSGTAPSGFTVNINTVGLAPGLYNAAVTITSAQATNSPQTLTIILDMLNPVDIKLTPDSLNFYARQGDPNPADKNVGITNGIGSGIEFNWGAIETSPWLALSATTGTSPSTLTFSVDIAGLSVGTYNTLVVIKQISLPTGVTDDIDTVYVTLLVDQPTGVEDDHGAIPKSFSLAQNYPNPFNPETVIEYSLAAPGNVTLTVFNVIGQRVATVVDEYQSAGNKQAVWNGRDDNGREVQSGVYFYRLTTDSFSMTRKMMLLK